MAQKKNTKGKKGAKAAAKKPEVISDLHADFTTATGANLTIDLYDSDDDRKADRVKITVGDAVVIYGKAVVMDEYAFLSWPSFKTKDDKFINTVFCFDSELNEKINDALTDYYFD